MIPLLYHLIALLDTFIYSIASSTFRIIIDIATLDPPLFRQEQIEPIATRVYIVVGVLILFKLIISAIQYLINPDVFEDKEKGIVGILKKIVISIALIVVTPAIFNFMLKIQAPIIKTIPSVVLGVTAEEANEQIRGYDLSFQALKTFVRTREPGKHQSDGKDDVGPGKQIHDFGSFNLYVTDGCKITVLGWLVDGLTGNSSCTYDYMIIISTIMGGFLVYVTLSMALDVAIREIKFGVIQMLAPIPISSYVFSPDKLKKFAKTAGTVYADLFIRLAIIYFIIFAAQEILRTGILNQLAIGGGVADTGSWFRNVVVNNTLLSALLMFAKKAPKFISELLGLPDISSGDLAEMFKPAWQRNGLLAAVGGTIGAGVANMANKVSQNGNPGDSFGQKLKNTFADKEKRRDMLKSGIAGSSSAAFHGGVAAAQGKGGSDVWKSGYKHAIQARQNRDLDKLNGLTGFEGFKERAKVKMTDTLGIDTQASLAENKQKAYSTLHQDVGSFKKAVMGRIDKNPSVAMRTDAKYGSAIHQLGQMLMENSDAINDSGNQDLMTIRDKFKSVTDSNGRTVYTLKDGEHLGYYDLDAVRVNAEQSHIGSISAKMEPLKTIAQKEIFSDAMAGKVVDVSGNLMDEFNYGNEGYAAAGYTQGADGIWRDAAGKARSQAHSDVTTAVQSAMQHITENGVPLGIDTTLLQKWFQGTATAADIDSLPPEVRDKISPELRERIIKGDFGALDDEYQRRSEALSGEMATSREHLARASLERRNANKDKK